MSASKLLIWLQTRVAGVQHGNSLVVRRLSPDRIIVVLFWTKYAVPRQIKLGILKLEEAKTTFNLALSLFLLDAKKKDDSV